MRTHALARAGLLAGLVTGVASCLPSPCVVDDDCPVGAYCKGATVVRDANGDVDDEKSTDGACTFGSNPDGTSSSSGSGGGGSSGVTGGSSGVTGGSSGVTGGSSGVTGGSSGVTGGSSGASNMSSTMGGSSGVSGGTSTLASSSSSTTTGGTSVASGGSSATNSSGVSGASSVDTSSSSASGGSTGASSGMVVSSSVGGGSSALASSSGNSSSSGAPPPATLTLDFPDRRMVVGQGNFAMRVTVTNTTGSTIFLEPMPVLHVQPSIGGADLSGYSINPLGQPTRGSVGPFGSLRFFVMVTVSNGAVAPASRLVRMGLEIPWATGATGSLEPNNLNGMGTVDLMVLELPTVSNVVANPGGAVNPAGVSQCPQVCFNVGQAQGAPVDVLVEYDRGGNPQRATQSSAAFDRASAGTRGLDPGGNTYCFSWNAPLDTGVRSSPVTVTMRVTPSVRGVSGTRQASGNIVLPSTMRQCGADFNAPYLLQPQRALNAAASADLDRDGQPDVVLSTLEGTNAFMNILRGTGGGSMVPAGNQTSVGRAATTLAVGRFNADATPDIVTGERGNIRWYTFNSTLGMTEVATSPLSNLEPALLMTGDMDGDGISEVMHTNPGLGEMEMRRLSGATVFPVTWAPLVEVRDFDVGDFDLDGLDDVVAVTITMNATRTGTVGLPRVDIMRGGSAAFSAGALFQPLVDSAALAGCDPEFVRLADFDGPPPATPPPNNPRLPDLAVLCADGGGGSRPLFRFTQDPNGNLAAANLGDVGPNAGTGTNVLSVITGEFDGSPGADLMVVLNDGTSPSAYMATMENGGPIVPFGPPAGRGVAVDFNHDGKDDILGGQDFATVRRAALWRNINGGFGAPSRGVPLTSIPDRLFSLPTGSATGDAVVAFDFNSSLVRFWSRVEGNASTLNLGLQSGENAKDIARGPIVGGSNMVVVTADAISTSRLRAVDISSAGAPTLGPVATVANHPVARVATGVHFGAGGLLDAVTVGSTIPRVLQAHQGGGTIITSLGTTCNGATEVLSHAVGRVGAIPVIAATHVETNGIDTRYYTSNATGVTGCATLNPGTPQLGRNPRNMVFANEEAAFTSTLPGPVQRVNVQRLHATGTTLVNDGEIDVWTGQSSLLRLGTHPFGPDPDVELLIQADGAIELFRRQQGTPPTYDRAMTLFSFGAASPSPGPRAGDFNGDGVMDLLWVSSEGGEDVFRVAYGF